MCHSRANNGKINRLHERCLRIIYSDKQSSFETLLEKDGSVSAHNRNLQILATEMYKIKNDLSPLIVTELFEQRNEHTTTSERTLSSLYFQSEQCIMGWKVSHSKDLKSGTFYQIG